MNTEEKRKILDMASRINTVASTLCDNEPDNFTEADMQDLATMLQNIASVMTTMAEEEAPDEQP